ncbi:MAG: hypothetical protein ACO26Y_04030 [Burkholderiaceae bacterium]
MNRQPDPSLVTAINARGFREWHSYELARSFGYLALGVLMLVCALAIMEGVFERPNTFERLFKLFLTFFSLCMTGWAWWRFIQILLHAEEIGRQAVCRQCQRYGRIEALTETPTDDPQHRSLTCRCTKCDHVWSITYTVQSRNVHP